MPDDNEDKVTTVPIKPTGKGRYGVRHVMEEQMFGSPENKDAQSLRSMKKAELVAMAEAEGVAIETDDNREDLIRKIEEARG